MWLQLLDPSLLINILLAVVGWTIQRELHHIREAINNVSANVTRAQLTSDRAHERIDEFIKDLQHFP